MKTLCLLVLVAATATAAYSQPTLNINNCATTPHAYISYDGCGPAPAGYINGAGHKVVEGGLDLGGVNARAGVYVGSVGTPQEAMVLLAPACAFRSGAAAGCIDCGTSCQRTVPDIAIGATVQVQMRAWDAGIPGIDSYEIAEAMGNSGHSVYLGRSAIFQVVLGTMPPPTLVGMQPFSIQCLPLASAPFITVQLTNQTVAQGSNVLFITTATGTPAPTFQWYFNSNLLAGYTNFSLSLTNLQYSNAGPYFVVASNYSGTVTSQVAVLTIAPGLDLQMVPAINVRGAIGQTYRVEYLNAAGPTNLWLLLATVLQTNWQQFYFDLSAIGQPARFYRVVEAPSP